MAAAAAAVGLVVPVVQQPMAVALAVCQSVLVLQVRQTQAVAAAVVVATVGRAATAVLVS